VSYCQIDPLEDEQAAAFRAFVGAAGGLELRSWSARFNGERYRVLQSRDPLGKLPDGTPDLRWHLSVSWLGGGSVPPWDALVAIAHAVRPGVPFIVAVPPRSMWMNVHPGVLHLVETKDANLIEQWRFEAQGHEPS
jgi:hypothetical protein